MPSINGLSVMAILLLMACDCLEVAVEPTWVTEKGGQKSTNSLWGDFWALNFLFFLLGELLCKNRMPELWIGLMSSLRRERHQDSLIPLPFEDTVRRQSP